MRRHRVRKPSAKAIIKTLNNNYTSLSTSPGPAIKSLSASVPPFTETCTVLETVFLLLYYGAFSTTTTTIRGIILSKLIPPNRSSSIYFKKNRVVKGQKQCIVLVDGWFDVRFWTSRLFQTIISILRLFSVVQPNYFK